MESRGRAKKKSRLKDILLALKNRVVTLEESTKDVKQKLDKI